MYKSLLKPILFKFDPERVHDFFLRVGSTMGRIELFRNITTVLLRRSYPRLKQKIDGVKFPNPVGLSAGFDKNAEIVDILPSVGFGFAQVGTVTFKPYEGNPKPRLTRLKKTKGIVVYYGLKNIGVHKIMDRLSRRKDRSIPISVSVGKTNNEYTATQEAGVKDYVDCTREVLKSNQADIITINISCPNTFGGEPFTTPESLALLMAGLDELEFDVPVYIKMPVDKEWEDFKELIEVLYKFSFVKGVIISNLVKDRDKKTIDPEELELANTTKGGISGKPVEEKGNKLISETYKAYGSRFTIIGVGGVFSAEDAYRKITLGASLVQLITGMIFEGPQLIKEINKGLEELLQRDGYSHISEAIGSKNE